MAHKSYRDLNVYQVSLALFLKVHIFSRKLPKYELYELGSQLRRAADSINSNIVEGYGRKQYKKDVVRLLHIAQASNDETINHLHKVGLVYSQLKEEAEGLRKGYNNLGKQIWAFQNYVASHWKT